MEKVSGDINVAKLPGERLIVSFSSPTGHVIGLELTSEKAEEFRTRIEVMVPKDTSMTANAANRVKNAVERVVDKVEKAADATALRLDGLADKALDKFHEVETHVADPLEEALSGLDDLLNIGSNRPPLGAQDV